MTWLITLLACWLAGAPGWAATVSEVSAGRDRIVIRFDQPIAGATSFLLDGPRRIAVDMAARLAARGAPAEPGGVVSAIREAALPRADRKTAGEAGSRIVFDLTRPAIVEQGRFGRDGRSLTLILGRVSGEAFAAAAADTPMRFAAGSRRRYEVAVAVPAPSRGLALPRVDGDPDRPLVVIDPGHGGVDPGAIAPGDGRREKDVTLRIAKAIRDSLLESGRVRVALTREDDRFLMLQERFGVARRLHADLFISIHCDSVGASTGSGDASGASVYTLSEVASDKESARLAARENKADIIAGIDLGTTGAEISSILIDLTQRETMNSSAGFARLLGREAQPLIPLKPNFHRMASLMVLKAPDMPSILFETGYISNPRDAAFIDSVAGRERIAESVRRAVEIHFARRLASAD